MSWAVPSSERRGIPAAVEAVLHRRPSPEKLYWRLQRPRASVYARGARRVLLNRAAASAAAIIAIALGSFLGSFLGSLGTSWWPPPAHLAPRTLNLAAVQAVMESTAWVPAFIVLGLILAIIPRPRRWIFWLTVLGAGALGYFAQRLPPFRWSAFASVTTEPAAVSAFLARLSSQLMTSTADVASAMAVTAAVAGYLAYRLSYRFAVRGTGLIPRRPVSSYRSTFAGLTMLQRLAAVPVTAALLLAGVWIAESARAPLPGVRYRDILFGYSHPSYLPWALAVLILAWAVCMPRPNGSQWLFILLFLGLAGYAFLPHVYLIRMPPSIPVAGPGSFGALVIAYLCVTGFGYTLVAALLDWR